MTKAKYTANGPPISTAHTNAAARSFMITPLLDMPPLSREVVFMSTDTQPECKVIVVPAAELPPARPGHVSARVLH